MFRSNFVPLVEGKTYVWRARPAPNPIADPLVCFVAYTACPPIVLVCDLAGKIMRVPRSELFAPTTEATDSSRTSP